MKKLLGVGKFTTHPPWRNNDIFLKKVGFEEVFQQFNYKGISELFFFEAIPSLKLSFNPGWGGGGEGQKTHSHLVF